VEDEVYRGEYGQDGVRLEASRKPSPLFWMSIDNFSSQSLRLNACEARSGGKSGEVMQEPLTRSLPHGNAVEELQRGERKAVIGNPNCDV
jgi:hypothetical protein